METDCIFCKIVAGELPSHRVYEDEQFIGILDIRPRSAGHTLIIPKAHHRWVWDVPNSGAYFEATTKVAKALQKSFGTDEVHSRIMGNEVPHAHIWIYPCPEHAQGDPMAFEENAARIRAAL